MFRPAWRTRWQDHDHRICEGLTAPDSGTVQLLGRNWASDEEELRQRIGIQLQETQFPEKLTVTETLRLFRTFFAVALPPKNQSEPHNWKKSATRAWHSLGWPEAAPGYGCALVGDPELLFLDEPTTGSIRKRAATYGPGRWVETSGRTIILTTHYMDERSGSATASPSWIMDASFRWAAHSNSSPLWV